MSALASLMMADAPGMRNMLQVMSFMSCNELLVPPQGAAAPSVQQVRRFGLLGWPDSTCRPDSTENLLSPGAASTPVISHPARQTWRLQVKSELVEECLRALHLLAREGRQCDTWEAALLEYLKDVGSSSSSTCDVGSNAGSGGHSGAGSSTAGGASGDTSGACTERGSTHDLLACRLGCLGGLPLTALVPLHSLCCWLVGHSFADVADLGREAQVRGVLPGRGPPCLA